LKRWICVQKVVVVMLGSPESSEVSKIWYKDNRAHSIQYQQAMKP
jgi:hypothetical protein